VMAIGAWATQVQAPTAADAGERRCQQTLTAHLPGRALPVTTRSLAKLFGVLIDVF